jgi:hypothetical protein
MPRAAPSSGPSAARSCSSGPPSPLPEAPDGLAVIGPDAGEDYTQHYFDSRGIARLYAMTFDGRDWTLERHTPDFSPLPFHQRWVGTFSADGETIEGRWETSPNGRDWEPRLRARLPAGETTAMPIAADGDRWRQCRCCGASEPGSGPSRRQRSLGRSLWEWSWRSPCLHSRGLGSAPGFGAPASSLGRGRTQRAAAVMSLRPKPRSAIAS